MSDVKILRRHGQRAYELARDLKSVVYDTPINSEEAQFLCSELQREVSRLASQIPPNVDPSEFADQGSDERETVDELGEVKALSCNHGKLDAQYQVDNDDNALRIAKSRALAVYNDWTNNTGILPLGTSYYYECQSIVMDAVEIGYQAGTGKESELRVEREIQENLEES